MNISAMKSCVPSFDARTWRKISIILPLFLIPGQALAQSSIEMLRQQLEEQRALIEQQRTMLQSQQERIEQQARQLDRLSNRLTEMEQAAAGATPPQAGQVGSLPAQSAETATPLPPDQRDSVGDLNAEAVKEGSFPGSFRIPGTRDVSLAIGGFVKAVGLYDTRAEGMGSDFLPATLGTRSSDREGAFSLDATLTRLHIDGRAPVPGGNLRGYVEYDLNDGNNGSLGFKLRHAYGSWTNSIGTLLAGHTWSTFMDIKILPEGLTEPTLSGPIFSRQAQLRWSQAFGDGWLYHLAIEDPSSNDFSSSLSNEAGKTSVPDLVFGLEHEWRNRGHIRLNSMVRRIEVKGDVRDSETAWGLTLTGHLDAGAADRVNLGAVYGKGVGRYLLGIQSTSGAAVDAASGLELRDNWGVMTTFQHHWSNKLRSTIMAGYAHSKPLAWQGAGTFESSTYAAANLMWSPYPYLTLGVEYGYGKLDPRRGAGLDNHRIGFGFQFY